MLNNVNFVLIYSHFVSSVRAELSSAKVKGFWTRQCQPHTHRISRRLTTSAMPHSPLWGQGPYAVDGCRRQPILGPI
jgi:hypothetical protein